MKRGQVVLAISVIAGVILLISGTSGPSAIYSLVLQKLPLVIQDSIVLSVVNTIVLVFIGLSPFGGFLVILGGYLVFRSHIRIGKLVIGMGGGVGIPWLLFILVWLLITADLMAVIASHSILGWTGIVLAFLARNFAG